jgi:hypothetical protein
MLDPAGTAWLTAVATDERAFYLPASCSDLQMNQIKNEQYWNTELLRDVIDARADD